MAFLTLSKAATLLSVTLALLAQAESTKRPCGLKIAPCPKSQVCVPNNPECTNPDRCLGTCDYPSCGGFTRKPRTCGPTAQCVDDAREQGCGQACDKPGICVPKKHPTCNGEKDGCCPNGMKCFKWWTEGPVVDLGDDSVGICLMS